MKMESNLNRKMRLKYVFYLTFIILVTLFIVYYTYVPTFDNDNDSGVDFMVPAAMEINFSYILLPFMIFLVFFLTALAVSYVQTSRKIDFKAHKEIKKRPAVSISYTKNHVVSNPIPSSIELLKEIIISDDIDQQEKKLTLISHDLLRKIDLFEWDEEVRKRIFLNEIAALTPCEREEIIEYMLLKSKNMK